MLQWGEGGGGDIPHRSGSISLSAEVSNIDLERIVTNA